MLAETAIELEARYPEMNRMRRWSAQLGQDLFGMWIVDIEFGRIGTRGRQLRRVFPSQPAARAYLGIGLRRRATAPARIGVTYRCVHTSLGVEELLVRVKINAFAPA
jgi:predicted DNA-binding WGR domain protein